MDPQQWIVNLPGGGVGIVVAQITLGEATVAVVCLLLLFLQIYQMLGATIRLWLQR